MGFIEELKWRGLLHQLTATESATIAHLATPGRVGYAGFDPTRDSLTIGNLIPILLLRRFQAAGHRPVVLMGGGTGLIGDPSGKDAERQLQTREVIEGNVAAQRSIFERLMRLNYLGSVYPTFHALPHLKRAGGRIVAVASMAGLIGVPTRTGYSAAKHAVVGFFDSLRVELADAGVSVTVVCPDFVVSEIHKRALGPDGRPLAPKGPNRRIFLDGLLN